MDPPKIPSTKEVKYHQNPISFSMRILALPSLYGGKLHALLCKNWQGGRVKGRDFYDYLWYKKNKIHPNLTYLKAKLVQSGHWNEKDQLNQAELNKLLKTKFQTIDWTQAKSDVQPFLRDPFALEVWSNEFFISTLD